MEEIKLVYAYIMKPGTILKARGQAGSTLPQKTVIKVAMALTAC